MRSSFTAVWNSATVSSVSFWTDIINFSTSSKISSGSTFSVASLGLLGVTNFTWTFGNGQKNSRLINFSFLRERKTKSGYLLILQSRRNIKKFVLSLTFGKRYKNGQKLERKKLETTSHCLELSYVLLHLMVFRFERDEMEMRSSFTAVWNSATVSSVSFWTDIINFSTSSKISSGSTFSVASPGLLGVTNFTWTFGNGQKNSRLINFSFLRERKTKSGYLLILKSRRNIKKFVLSLTFGKRYKNGQKLERKKLETTSHCLELSYVLLHLIVFALWERWNGNAEFFHRRLEFCNGVKCPFLNRYHQFQYIEQHFFWFYIFGCFHRATKLHFHFLGFQGVDVFWLNWGALRK